MNGALEYIGRVAQLHQLAGVHHADAVGYFGHDGNVVGDVKHAHVQVGLDLLDLPQDAVLNDNVQRRGGLVGDNHVGLAGQSHCDNRPLPHSPAELMGIPVGEPRVQPHQPE